MADTRTTRRSAVRTDERSGYPTASEQSAAGRLPLREWLDVSWFYPDGFERERLETLDDGWLVYGRLVNGNGFVYRFYEPPTEPGAPPLGARERLRRVWQLACEELLDNAPLAPSLHFSLRLLRWNDDEPLWVTLKPDSSLDPYAPPEGVDDVALVTRRLPDSHTLSGYLRKRDEVPESLAAAVADSLARFHRRQRDVLLQADGAKTLSAVAASTIEALNRSFLTYGSFLDPYSRASFIEVHAFLGSFLKENESLFARRVLEGWVTDVHGDLSLDAIAVPETQRVPRHAGRPGGPGRGAEIFGRPGRGAASRLGDVLSDLATLSVELECRGYRALGREIERLYGAKLKGSVVQPLLRYYKAARALDRGLQNLVSGSGDAVAAVQYFAIALQHALGLTRPFLLVIGGSDPIRSELARAVHELVPSAMIDEAIYRPRLPVDPPRETIFDRLLRVVAEKLDAGRSVVVTWPVNRDEERRSLARLAETRGSAVMLLRFGEPEHAHCTSWPPPPEIPSLDVTALMSSAELALWVMRNMVAHRTNRMRLEGGRERR